jgi:hypothetical protein
MQIEPRRIIAVRPAGALAARPRLFAALEAAFPVTFRADDPGAPAPDAVIVIAKDPGAPPVGELTRAGLPVLVVADTAEADAPEQGVRLADHGAMDPRLRGIIVSDRQAGSALTVAERDDVLATSRNGAGGAVWTRARGPAPIDTVRCALPELTHDQVLSALLWRRTVVGVAIISFLRAVSAADGWQSPPLRAAFLFDDPNLRWRSYGFIDYRRLVEHADTYGYHAAMAMIPLDAGRPHRPTVSLFARRRDRLSLVCHGNDHVKQELLRPREPGDALAMAAQAMRRIERFERGAGLRVDHVMTPPHGLCSENVTRALGAVGFDALCAIHPIPWTGDPPPSVPLAGWDPADFVAGCAVIPRRTLDCSAAEIAVHAFLDHPIVLYGHHDDLANGLEPLADAAARVNRLGDVRWMALGDMALTNHVQRVRGDHVAVTPFARRLRVSLPAGARTLTVREPRQAYGAPGLVGWSLGSGPVLAFGAQATLDQLDPLEVLLHGSRDIDAGQVPAPAWRPWPKLRRAGTEVRDRALPLRPARAR